MKSRIRIICLLIIALLLCVACARQEAPSGTVSDATEEAAETDNTEAGTEPAETTSTEADEKPAETYSYIENEDADNRFPRIPSIDVVQFGQYYFGAVKSSRNLYLHCYDGRNKAEEIVCGKPDCTHDTEECNAYYRRDIPGLSLYHGSLYWIGIEGEGKKDTLAMRCMDPFSGKRQTVRSIDEKEIIHGYWPQRMRVHRGMAYLECMKQTIVEGAQPKHKLSLLAMPLSEKGETRILFERDYDCGASMQVRYCGDYIFLFCSLNSSEPKRNWYEVYRINTEDGACETVVSALEPNCYIDDFWVDEAYRLLVSGRDKEDWTKAFVWQIEDGALKDLYSFASMKGEAWPLLFDHIAFNLGYENGERLCCICDFDGNVLFEGKLTQPTQIPDLYPASCKVYGINIVGGDAGMLLVEYNVRDGKAVDDAVLVMYDLQKGMDCSVIWVESNGS